MSMNSAKLDQRIRIELRAAGQNELGEAVGGWELVGEVWAQRQPLRGRELFAAGQLQRVTDVRFRIRWRADVDASMRLVWNGQPHEIIGEPIDVDSSREYLELMCATGIRDGR